MDEALRESLLGLSSKIGYAFNDLSLLAGAVRHSSWVHEHPGEAAQSNERLEFLGDAVLELVITEFLYKRFPQSPEGRLSKARSGVVNEARLADTARSLDLGDYLLLGHGEEIQGGREKPSLLADALEAVFAAVYLDGGLESAAGLLLRLLGPQAEQSLEAAPRKDFKTRLQERVQEKYHFTPRYKLLGSEGPDHDKTFHVALMIDDRQAARGSGKSKKEAQQNAAQRGLARWEELGEDWLKNDDSGDAA